MLPCLQWPVLLGYSKALYCLFSFVFKTMQERLKALLLSQHFKGASVLFARLLIYLPTIPPKIMP